MFGGLFGENRKNALIRELLEMRMRAAGFDDIEHRLRVKQLGKMELLGSPEATLVWIIEAVIKNEKRGAQLFQTLQLVEGQRKPRGDYLRFNEILSEADHGNPGTALFDYCYYRLELEHYGVVTPEQCLQAIGTAIHEIKDW